jgi:acetylornithine deacetylase
VDHRAAEGGAPGPGWAAGLVADLVALDSQNPRLVQGAPGESALAARCVAWLGARGVDAWLDEVEPGRHNAVARVGRGRGPVLALCAHLDTVSAAGMEGPPFQGRVEGGRLYGRGAYDMKGSVAAILEAMARLAESPPAGTVMAALVVDEEYASSGAYDFVGRYPGDGCIVTEPSEGRLVLAHKGFVWLELETRGVAAHGSRWQDGVSAIGGMGRIIGALERFDGEVLRGRTHPLLGPASLHCAVVSGGEGWSTYAPSCTLRVERRTLPGETPESVVAELQALLAELGEAAEVRVALARPPLECPADSPLAGVVREAAQEVTGRVPGDAGVAYWMDAAVFAEAGYATVNYGPGGGGAHAAVEWVELASVESLAGVLEGAARRYCG